jgi:hypothetical protein
MFGPLVIRSVIGRAIGPEKVLVKVEIVIGSMIEIETKSGTIVIETEETIVEETTSVTEEIEIGIESETTVVGIVIATGAVMAILAQVHSLPLLEQLKANSLPQQKLPLPLNQLLQLS